MNELSQVFCGDVLYFFPHHQLCVNQGFHFVGSSSVLCFLERDQMAEVATLLAVGPFLEAFHIHLSASSTASPVFVLLLSTSPSVFFRMDYQIIVISELHHDASANAATGSSL